MSSSSKNASREEPPPPRPSTPPTPPAGGTSGRGARNTCHTPSSQESDTLKMLRQVFEDDRPIPPPCFTIVSTSTTQQEERPNQESGQYSRRPPPRPPPAAVLLPSLRPPSRTPTPTGGAGVARRLIDGETRDGGTRDAGGGTGGIDMTQEPTVPTHYYSDEEHQEAMSDLYNEKLKTVTMEDVKSGGSGGQVLTVLGVRLSLLRVVQLRYLCSRLSIRGYKNKSKDKLVDLVVVAHNNYKKIQQLYSQKHAAETTSGNTSRSTSPVPPHLSSKKPRKQAQCTWRLLNVLFSDEFYQDFQALGDTPDRQILDTGKAGNEEYFWIRVQNAFVSPVPNREYDTINEFNQDPVLLSIIQAPDNSSIDPSIIVQHDWKKLRSMWKALSKEYREALAGFNVSGHNANSFFDFCTKSVSLCLSLCCYFYTLTTFRLPVFLLLLT